jgi:hypothetical protein
MARILYPSVHRGEVSPDIVFVRGGELFIESAFEEIVFAPEGERFIESIIDKRR